jgi:hypothetical protein
MAEELLRKGQPVYAADGTYLGRLLQRDAQFMVIGKSRWRPDHVLVADEEVAAVSSDAVLLRSLPERILPETAQRWWPAPDPLGNADGVDLEPIRAGMAELEEKAVGTWSVPPLLEPVVAPAPPPMQLPSDEDAYGLACARVARLEAQVERRIAAEIEDVEIEGACVAPPGFEPGARYEVEEPWEGVIGRGRSPLARPFGTAVEPARSSASGRGGAPATSSLAHEASSSPQALARVLRAAGFSPVEAEAIAGGGFGALARVAAAGGRA